MSSDLTSNHPSRLTLSLDLRSLAAFRLAVGLALLIYLIGTLCNLSAFYTHAGVLPQDVWSQTADSGRWSLHAVFDSPHYVYGLLALQCLLAILLTLGWRTRLSTLLSLALLISLLHRNPMLVGPIESLLITLLFCGSLLPLSERYSVDAALAANPPPSDPQHRSPIAMVLLLLLGASLLSGPLALILEQNVLPAGPAELALLIGLHLAAFSIFLGPKLWEQLAQWEVRKHPGNLRIYYDGNCPRCHRVALLLREFLLLPRVQLMPAQDSPRAKALYEANRSWVVIDAHETAHLHWEAFIVLLKNSALFFWLAPMCSGKFMTSTGTRLLRYCRELILRRGYSSPLRTRQWTLPVYGCWLAAGLLALQFFQQLSMTTSVLPAGLGQAMNSYLSPPLRVLSLEQRWWLDAALNADHGARWIVVPGTFADGSEIDLLRHPQPPNYAPHPDDSTLRASGTRWARYHRFLGTPEGQMQLPHYAEFLCRQSYAPRPPPLSLKITEILAADARPDHAALEQRVLLRHQCSPTSS